MKMGRGSSATKGLTKLHGAYYIDINSGDVYGIYGGWHRIPIGNVKGTKAFRKVRETYGKRNGAKNRKALALAIFKGLTRGKGKKIKGVK